MITGSRSRPWSVRIHETGVGRAWRSSVLMMMPASLNSLSLLDNTLGVRVGFERNSLLKLSTLRNPISARIKNARLASENTQVRLDRERGKISRVFSQVFSRQQVRIYSVTLSKLYRRDEAMPTYDDSRVKSQPEHSCRGKGMGRGAKQEITRSIRRTTFRKCGNVRSHPAESLEGPSRLGGLARKSARNVS